MSIKFSVGISDKEHERERDLLERSRSAPRPVHGSEDPGTRPAGWRLLTSGADDDAELDQRSWAW